MDTMGMKKSNQRVAIYARVSTNKKVGDSNYQETENQLLQLREYCERNGWKIISEYVDRESGGSSSRKNFKKLFQDAQKRKFDIVLFWALDRFTREGTLKALHYLQELEHYGIFFYSYTEAYLNNMGAFRDVVISILATIAKQERIRQSERVKAGLERARRQGKRLGRKPISQEKLNEIDVLRKKGLSIRKISERTSVSRGKVGERVKNNSAI